MTPQPRIDPAAAGDATMPLTTTAKAVAIRRMHRNIPPRILIRQDEPVA